MEALLVKHIVERAATIFPNREIVARTIGNGRFRYTYGEYYDRIKRLAAAMEGRGVTVGDGVGVLDWNSYQHLEIDYATVCKGSIYQGLNFRLGADSLVYMSNLAKNKILFVEESFIPLAEQMVAGGANTIEAFVLISKDPTQLPESTITPWLRYEELIETATADYEFPEDIDENDPVAVCFTGGTTGRPKGCPYSNRFLVLRSLTRQSAQSMGPYSGRDVFFITPPMFHGHAFNLPMDAFIAGAKMVIPGPHPDGHVFAELIEQERVTRFLANPIMGKMLLQAQDEGNYNLSSISYTGFGGDVVPAEMTQRFMALGDKCRSGGHGMAESLADHTTGFFDDMPEYSPDAAFELMQNNAGLPLVGCQTRVLLDDGSLAPADGKTMGELQLKGWHVIPEYFRDPENTEKLFIDGWLRTGDMGVQNPDGSYAFKTRSKDMIKSGGEWIPAMILENALAAHPAVRDACIIGAPHAEYGERPIGIVTLTDRNAEVDAGVLQAFMRDKVEKWMVPDVVIVDEIAKTTVGKFNKVALREDYAKFYIA